MDGKAYVLIEMVTAGIGSVKFGVIGVYSTREKAEDAVLSIGERLVKNREFTISEYDIDSNLLCLYLP